MDRDSAIEHLVCECGLSHKEAEKLIPKSATGETSRIALNPDQLDVFSRAAKRIIRDPSLRALLLLLPLTGLRVAAMCSLTWGNLVIGGEKHGGAQSDPEDAGRTGVRFVGKGQKERFVPMTRKAMKTLIRETERAQAKGRYRVYLFPNKSGTKPIAPARVRSACQRIVAAEPSLQGLTPHVLRHTYASMAFLRCQDVKELQQNLGHNSRKTTLVYLHEF